MCLSEVLGQTQEEIEEGVAKVARGQDGFIRVNVFNFLQAEIILSGFLYKAYLATSMRI